MVKINGRAGHNYKLKGASRLLDEVEENRRIMRELSFMLKSDRDFDYEETTPETTDTLNGDLNYGISRANLRSVDLFFSLHLNSSGEEVAERPIGTEVLIYSGSVSEVSGNCGRYICMEMENLGFKNRGLKYGENIDGLAEIKNTVMPAMIIEGFFLNSRADVDLYKSLGPREVAKAIYRGIKKGTGTFKDHEEVRVMRTCETCSNYKAIEG